MAAERAQGAESKAKRADRGGAAQRQKLAADLGCGGPTQALECAVKGLKWTKGWERVHTVLAPDTARSNARGLTV